MTAENPSHSELLAEMAEIRSRLEEAEETLRAIGNGEVDAFVVSGPEGDQVFTLKGAEQPYRILVETMNEGAATLAADGTILYCNNRLANMLQMPLENLIGKQLGSYLSPADRPHFAARLDACTPECAMDEITLVTRAGDNLPVLSSCCSLDLSGTRGVSVVITDLTQQKRNEEIMTSEMLARSIIEQAGEAIVVCDDKGVIIRASRVAHKLCGVNPLLKPFDEVFRLRLPETADFFSVLPSRQCGCSGNLEVEFKRGDDQLFHLILNATPLYGVKSGVIGCVVTLTDITGRRLAEQELRESESKFRSLFDNSIDAVFLTVPDGRVLSANSAACKMFRMSEAEIIRVGRAGLSDPDDPGHAAALAERRRTGRVGAVELEYLRSSGERFPAEVDSVILPGDPQRSFVIVRDITERKLAEKELRESEERFRTLFNTMVEGFCIIEVLFSIEDKPVDYRFLVTNPAFEAQAEMHEVQGKLVSELVPGLEMNWFEIYGKVASNGEPVRFVNESKVLNRWFDVRAYKVGGPESRKIAVLFSDITEAKRAEDTLKKMNQELEKRVVERTAELREKDQMLLLQSRQAAMGEMIGNIAHQWRQPLNLLGLTAQQLLLYYDMGQFDRSFLVENVGGSMKLIHHMSQTIDDFRNYFKPDKEKVEFKVRDIVANTLSLLEGSFQDPRIAVEIHAKADPVICGYPNEFSQVFLNILINAKDVLTERETDNPKVTITISSEDDCAVVAIADNAGGIPEEIIEKIFDPYFSTKGVQGTGIGLFMSKTIVEKNMGGRLEVRNKDNGAEFRIEICTN
jgi:PAS domain S-box-containing protein